MDDADLREARGAFRTAWGVSAERE